MSRVRLASVLAFIAVVLVASVTVTVSFQQATPDQAVQPAVNPTRKLALEQTWESPPGQIVDRTANQQLVRAVSMIQQDGDNADFGSILRQLQRILRADEDVFVTPDELPIEQVNPLFDQRPNVSLYSIKAVAEQIVNELPSNGRDAYERLFGVEAAAISKAAVSTNDIASIERLATHPTKAPPQDRSRDKPGISVAPSVRDALSDSFHEDRRSRDENGQPAIAVAGRSRFAA